MQNDSEPEYLEYLDKKDILDPEGFEYVHHLVSGNDTAVRAEILVYQDKVDILDLGFVYIFQLLEGESKTAESCEQSPDFRK
jgi:hypothetical protein